MTEAVAHILSELAGKDTAKGVRSASLLPVLQRVQRTFGYLPREVVPQIAEGLGMSESRIIGVATFYSQFRFTPAARNHVTVCRGTACHVRGSGKLLDDLSAALGIGPGETAADRSISLDSIACFGSCALAPVVVINDKVHGRMTKSKALKAIEAAKGQGSGAGGRGSETAETASAGTSPGVREPARPGAAASPAGDGGSKEGEQ